ncbi:MAG: hypothetical protein Q8P02_05160, partial [Candidatus Micrarchaeota archaeon]|nr:hypothetical protein [Candidatus Micrarchaeota archaeon]
IEFIDPDTMTVDGTVSNSSNSVGQNFTVEVTVTNPSNSENVTTSYSLQLNSSAFTQVGGDSANGTITLTPSESQTFTYTVIASGAAVNVPVTFGVGDSTTAFSSGVTNTASDSNAPVITLSSPAASAALTASSSAFTFSFTDSDSSGSATCHLYVDSTKSGSSASVAEGATGSITGSGLSSGAHTWFVNCIDAADNSGNASSRSFSVSSGGGSSATATPAAAAPSSSSSSGSSSGLPSAPTSTSTGETVTSSQTQDVGVSTSVRGSFAQNSAVFQVSYTAPGSGFKGDLTHHLPFDFADYQSGLITFEPEPSSVTEGSILASWSVALSPGETFTATVDVAKAVDSSVLQDFVSPKLTPASTPFTPPAATASVPSGASAPAPAASSDNTLWYVLGALVILGVLYYVFAGRKG